ncbi:MAG: hypothetical protein ACOYIB_02995 [Desulfosporosinus sp.]
MSQNFEFLEGFEKRMRIVAAIDSIVNRGNRKMELERLFSFGQLDNLIFSVLVFIMERTLSEDEECTMDSIADFVRRILPAYGLELTAETIHQLTEYMIKDILQNGGEARYYSIMTYGQGMTETRIRLIEDKLREDDRSYLITYQLTDQGYDLLFRTKEVEQEISFTIEELKLRELIKRKNYKKAIGQSSNLIQMVRQKKNELRQLMEKIRGNIYDVDIREYERLIGSTYALLEEEYSMMNEILGMITLSEERLREEEQTRGTLDEAMKKARTEITKIRRNIHTTINEQKELILDRHHLSAIYKETLEDSFFLAQSKKFDFEQEILTRLEQCDERHIALLWQLFNPLFKPNPVRALNILSLYEAQSRLRQEEQETVNIEIEELGEDQERLKAERINAAYIELMRCILEFAAEKPEGFYFSQLLTSLKTQEDLFQRLIEGDLLFHSLLKLYDLNDINIWQWQQEEHEVVVNPTGEFDLDYYLTCIEYDNPELFGIESLRVVKLSDKILEEEIIFRQGEGYFSKTISINDFFFEVKIK